MYKIWEYLIRRSALQQITNELKTGLVIVKSSHRRFVKMNFIYASAVTV